MQPNQFLLLKSVLLSVIITTLIFGAFLFAFQKKMKDQIIEEVRGTISEEAGVEPPGRSSPVLQIQNSGEY